MATRVSGITSPLETMTPEELRIEIAESWGAFPGSINTTSWLGYFPVEHSETLYSLGYLTHEQMESDEKQGYILATTPNFVGDLNAMAAAEKTLTNEEYSRYHWLLVHEICAAPEGVRPLSATALQRATAFHAVVKERA